MRPLNVMQYLAARGLSSGVIGGVENLALTLCEHLDRDILNVSVTCPYNSEVASRTAAIGVPLYPFPTEGYDKISYLKRIADLSLLLRQKQIDVLHVHATGFTGLNAFLAATLAQRTSVVVTHHSWYGPKPLGRTEAVSLRIEKYIAKYSIALYEEQARGLISAGLKKKCVVVVPNGVDVRKFQAISNSRTFDDPSLFRLAIVARLVDGKGHAELLQAANKLVERFPALRLLIVGDGPMRSRIEALIQELGLSGIVDLVGQVPNTEVPHLLQSAHAVVLPTYYSNEAFPITLLEGMAMGIPAIGSRHVGIPDIIVDGVTGLLVEPRDVEALKTAIESMVSNRVMAAEMGRKAKVQVEKFFSADNLGRAMTSIYTKAASPEGRGEHTEQAAPSQRIQLPKGY